MTVIDGDRVYLERIADGHRYRLGLNLVWGGVISEVSTDRANAINGDDAGREVQLSMYEADGSYDACAGCTGSWGWNPVQGGDRYIHGSPAQVVDYSPGRVHVAVRPHEWFPDNKGGGPTRAVTSDVAYDLFISTVPDHPAAFRVRYVLKHLGIDHHESTVQELPAVYPQLGYDRFVYYDGPKPWTGDDPTVLGRVRKLSEPWQGRSHTETWGAHVDASGRGVTVYVPGAYGHGVGWKVDEVRDGQRSGTNYFYLTTALGLGPSETVEGEYYVIAGDVSSARRTIYALHAADSRGDRFAPFVDVLGLTDGAVVGGEVPVRGYALDNDAVARVDMLVDGEVVGRARYGTPSPELGPFWGAIGTDAGFEYVWDTRSVSEGEHRLGARVTDPAGRVSKREVSVVVDNAGRLPRVRVASPPARRGPMGRSPWAGKSP